MTNFIDGMVSAVIPIYKVPEDYLRECIDSVLHQSYSDFQLILVDDGSPDQCGAICDTYATSDERITVIHQSNAGVSAARNAGLALAKGQFLTFVDADDILLPNAWEDAVAAMGEYSADLVAFGWTDFYENGSYDHHITDKPYIMSASDFQWEIACHNTNCGGGYPWNKMWRLDRLYEVHGSLPLFNVTLDIYEDKLWALQAVSGMQQVVLIPQLLYQYRFLSSSLTQNEDMRIKRLYKAYHAYDIILDYLEDSNDYSYIMAYNFYFTFCLHDLSELRQIIANDRHDYEEQYQKSRKVFHNLCRRIRPRTLHAPIRSREFFLWAINHYLPFTIV